MRELTFNWWEFGVRLGIVCAIIVISIIVVRLAVMLTRKIMAKSGVDKAVTGFVTSLIKSSIILVAIFLCGVFIGIPVTALVAIVSAITVALGLALQGSLSNLASGIVIAVTKPFVEGDFIDNGDISGKVRDIKLFNTELVTIDNKKIVIPNSSVVSKYIVNYTNQERRMVELIVPISYDESVDKVKEILLDIAKNNQMVLKDEEPIIRLHNYGESSLDIIFRVWVLNENYWKTYWDMREEIVDKFNKNNITIPYNKMDIYFKNDSEKHIIETN